MNISTQSGHPLTHGRAACFQLIFTLCLEYLSLLTVEFGSLHSGHDFPSSNFYTVNFVPGY